MRICELKILRIWFCYFEYIRIWENEKEGEDEDGEYIDNKEK
jgi:hypothetical protein